MGSYMCLPGRAESGTKIWGRQGYLGPKGWSEAQKDRKLIKGFPVLFPLGLG